MSILNWDDFEDDSVADTVDISTGSISLDSNELLLNAQLSDDPLSLVPAATVPTVFQNALGRLKGMSLETGPANASTERISRDDKTILGGGDVNQLIPIKYGWAWDKYLSQLNNNWLPTEINMSKDIAQWKATGDDSILTDDERRIIYNALGFFSTADTVVNNNLINIARHIKNPEQRQFIFRQIFEESMHCYIDGTEILTEHGYVDFRNLKAGVKVAQYHESGKIDFVIPQQILHDPYTGPMVEFSNDNGTYHSVVTPNHRCVAIDPRDGYKTKIIQAKDFYPHNYNVPAGGYVNSDASPTWTHLDALRVAFQADGSIANPHTLNMGVVSGKYVIQFAFKKQRKILHMLYLAKNSGFEYTVNDELSNGSTSIRIWIPIDIKMDKSFDWIDNIENLDTNWLNAFFSELSVWDGCLRDSGSICYTNTNWSAVDKVMTLASLNGRRTGLYTVAATDIRKEAYQVHIHRRNHFSGRVIKRKEIQHDGHVHCVAVPTGMIITRYNGCITVSGNTYSYQYCIQSLNLNESQVFNQYRENMSMAMKDNWCFQFDESMEKASLSTQELLENLIAFYVVMEGIFFYCGFSQVLALGRVGKMTGVAEQFQYILRDECLVGDTELLTPRGWLPITSITKETLVAQWNENGTIEFVHPTRLSCTEVDHTYHFSNYEGHVSQQVSENHRMLHYVKSGAIKVVPAKDTQLNPYSKIINTGELISQGRHTLDYYERFLIALQADGSIRQGIVKPGKLSGTQQVTFNLKKNRKIKRLLDILFHLQWRYTITGLDKKGRRDIHVYVPLEFSVHKNLDTWVDLSNVSGNWCKDFIEEVGHWDGSIANESPRRYHYGSTVKVNTDVVQAVASLAGYRTCYHLAIDDRKETFSDYHRLNITTHIQTTQGGSVKKERIDETTMVYGVEVPSTFILIRHNNAVSVTGNCAHLNYGIDLINQIKIENPEVWTPEFQSKVQDMIIEGATLEMAFGYDINPNGTAVVTPQQNAKYMQFIAYRRLQQLGLTPRFECPENPFPWMSEMIDINKEKNFFETRVIDYQQGSDLNFGS